MLEHVRGGESQRRFVDGKVAPWPPAIGVEASSHGGRSLREGVMAYRWIFNQMSSKPSRRSRHHVGVGAASALFADLHLSTTSSCYNKTCDHGETRRYRSLLNMAETQIHVDEANNTSALTREHKRSV
ncbi:hypothetical protein MUK42_34987 [Musa troglodytarum]|uniref:Uncharacterized protein n=1 Tax=Musa troglodytarum TaxID=320322 RepID=A0A9E7J9E6_9LILI|nr:hypothetical protein MUK42_34987 [Musa troglodytarum]